ncbi:hypothetical protein E2N92_02395 [Methanofollis formosanus]|uniref:Uncharacterized protein n=1 Tax=Methanofollis formosanus TaxID=299308 RepID=A0A8G1EFR0_9EURY|nr:hypothetical protein [Methanofollis formosanus]QYZ78361.1 hypothetical protein E2N92_02395 [Methanofollis formosanus]
MDARVLDVLTGAASLLLFVVLLVALPGVVPEGMQPEGIGLAYVAAFVIFLVTMSGAGYIIKEKIS